MTPRLRLLFQLCADAGLHRDDRIDLAEMLLNRDVPSYLDLDDSEVCRLLDAVRGHHYIEYLRSV